RSSDLPSPLTRPCHGADTAAGTSSAGLAASGRTLAASRSSGDVGARSVSPGGRDRLEGAVGRPGWRVREGGEAAAVCGGMGGAGRRSSWPERGEPPGTAVVLLEAVVEVGPPALEPGTYGLKVRSSAD